MTYATLESIDPFYAACLALTATPRRNEPDPVDKPVYARLPRAPITGSPVPHLTSLYHFARAGEYGDRKWPGNCGGQLIEDLLNYFKPGLVFDPMSGSGTARDVCEALGIPCISWDIHQGQDACDSQDFPGPETFDFIWRTRPTGGSNCTPTIPETCRAAQRSLISFVAMGSSFATARARLNAAVSWPS